jgi:Tfp pilus assembly protein PilX
VIAAASDQSANAGVVLIVVLCILGVLALMKYWR